MKKNIIFIVSFIVVILFLFIIFLELKHEPKKDNIKSNNSNIANTSEENQARNEDDEIGRIKNKFNNEKDKDIENNLNEFVKELNCTENTGYWIAFYLKNDAKIDGKVRVEDFELTKDNVYSITIKDDKNKVYNIIASDSGSIGKVKDDKGNIIYEELPE